VFKRSVKATAIDDVTSDEYAGDLAESYMLLISMSGFLDVSFALYGCNGKFRITLTFDLD
jgi:hypothetical protein